MGGVTAKIKQIGNSVPSVAAKLLYESIRKELDKADGVTARPIVIDDDEQEGVVVIDEEEDLDVVQAPHVPQFRAPIYDKKKEVIVLDEEDYIVVPPPRVAQFPGRAPFARRRDAPVASHRKKTSIVDDEIENNIVNVRKRAELVDISSDDESDVFYDC